MPVAAIARQAGCLDGHHRADLSSGDGRQQPFEPSARYSAGRDAQVIVDDHHLRTTRHQRPLCQGVLASAALMVVAQLVGGGLPDVHIAPRAKCSGLILLIAALRSLLRLGAADWPGELHRLGHHSLLSAREVLVGGGDKPLAIITQL